MLCILKRAVSETVLLSTKTCLNCWIRNLNKITIFSTHKFTYLDLWISDFRGGSKTSGNGVHMYKGVGFALLVLSHFS